MGKIEQGILGAFSGTVGTVVGSSWRGISYMKGKAATHQRIGSLKQDEQRAKFKLMVAFVRQVRNMVEPGFRKLAIHMTASNAALSFNLKNGITGAYPNFEVDYSMVLLSRGDLPNAGNPTVAAADTGSALNFTWVNNAGNGKALATDTCMVIAYCEDLQLAVSSNYYTGATRAAQAFTLDVEEFSGLSVVTYIAFFSANGKDISDSYYTGEVLIP